MLYWLFPSSTGLASNVFASLREADAESRKPILQSIWLAGFLTTVPVNTASKRVSVVGALVTSVGGYTIGS